jgi:hypothetical protein
MPPGAEKVVAANMMGPPELIEYSIIVFEAVTKKIKSEVRIIQKRKKIKKIQKYFNLRYSMTDDQKVSMRTATWK